MQLPITDEELKEERFLSPPLALPYNSYADIEREQYVEARPSHTPKYIYHLYTLHQETGQTAVPQPVRSYVSNDLAAHDALCWLSDMHRK